MARRRARRRGRSKRRQRGGSPARNIVILGLLGTLLLAGFIVWSATRPATGEEQEAVCVLVVDRTGSFKNDTIASRRNAADATVDGCRKEQARFTASYFSAETNKWDVLRDDEGASEFALWLPKRQKKVVGEDELEKAVDQAKAVAQSAFDKPSGTGSDIVTALRDAATNVNEMARGDGVDNKYLVLITDGEQNRGDINVDQLKALSPEALVDRVKQLGSLPQLNGTDVYFIGVSTGGGPDGNPALSTFNAKVESFWRQLVQAGGGKVCAYATDISRVPSGC